MLARLFVVSITLLCLVSHSLANLLGDLNRDGRVDRRDTEELRRALQSGEVDSLSTSGQRLLLSGDVNLNGDLDSNDLAFLEFYINRDESDKWAADTRLVGMLLGLVKGSGQDLQKTISECRQLSDDKRNELYRLLVDYVSNRGGVRKPQSGQPGSGLSILPRDGAFLACLTLMVAGASKLQEAVENRTMSPKEIGRQLRQADDGAQRLRALVSRRENINSETADQLRIGLTDLLSVLADLEKELPKEVVTDHAEATQKPTEGPPVATLKPKKEASKSSSSTLLLFGLGLGLPLAFAVIYLVHRQGQTESAPKIITKRPSRRPSKGCGQGRGSRWA